MEARWIGDRVYQDIDYFHGREITLAVKDWTKLLQQTFQ